MDSRMQRTRFAEMETTAKQNAHCLPEMRTTKEMAKFPLTTCPKSTKQKNITMMPYLRCMQTDMQRTIKTKFFLA
jgi:hypothetical protein